MQNRSRSLSLVAVALGGLLVASPAAASASQLPDTPAAARQQYESQIEEWADGPVQYLLTEQEKDLWDDLTTDAQRQAFKRWFWSKRDPDLRDDANPFLDVFYTRVAEANERFHGGGIYRGWESDRGRAWVLLGKPDGMQPNMGVRYDSQDWTYYTVGRDRAFETVFGEFHIIFVRPDPAQGYQVWDPFGGVGIWPTNVRDAFEYTRHAYIVNPDLELPSELRSAKTEITR